MTEFQSQLRQDLATGLADAEGQLATLANAGPDDLAEVVAIMERALDDDADPRLMAGVKALRRITTTS